MFRQILFSMFGAPKKSFEGQPDPVCNLLLTGRGIGDQASLVLSQVEPKKAI